MAALLKKFVRDDRGTETVEWAVMAGLFTAAVITAMSKIAPWIGTRFGDMQTALGL